jgi:hypothetical protein
VVKRQGGASVLHDRSILDERHRNTWYIRDTRTEVRSAGNGEVISRSGTG